MLVCLFRESLHDTKKNPFHFLVLNFFFSDVRNRQKNLPVPRS